MDRVIRKLKNLIIWSGYCMAICTMGFGWGMSTALAAQGNAGAKQSAKKPVLEEIVVTARRLTESIQDVPVTVSVVSDNEINRLALGTIDQLSTQVPGLIATFGGPSGAASIHIRGIGTDGGSVGFSSAVGVVIDGQYFSRARWIQPGMFDVQQVQVLKGPQALYWGKNNTAGLIILEGKMPGDTLEGYAKAGFENEANQSVVEGGISIPVSDNLGIRFAGKYTDMDGWMKNNAGPGVDPLGFQLPGASATVLPQKKEKIGRFALRWTPSDQFELNWSTTVDHQTSAGANSLDQLIACYGPGGTPQPALRVIPEPYAECNTDFTTAQGGISPGFIAAEALSPQGPKIAAALGPNGQQTTNWNSFYSSLRTEYKSPNAVVSTVTGLQRFEAVDLGAYTFDSSGSLPSFSINKYKALSQEVRVNTTFDRPVNFMGGVYFRVDDYYYLVTSRVAIFPPSSNGNYFSWERESPQDRFTWSIYSALTWNVSDTVQVRAGARFTNEELHAGMKLNYVHDIFHAIGFLNEAPFDTTKIYKNTSPQATITWRPTGNMMFYATYKTGFKSGGFDGSNTLRANVTGNDLLFDAEKADGFELGAKTELLDSRLRLNGSIYRYTYKNLQVQTFNADIIAFLTENAGKARTTGLDLDAEWVATENLRFRGEVNYNDAKYLQFITSCYAGETQEQGCNLDIINGVANATDLSGTQMPLAPKVVSRLGATYEFGLGSNWSAELNVDATYSSRYPIGVDGTVWQTSYVRPSASISIRDASDTWEVSLIGRNLNNKAVLVGAGERPFTGGPSGLPASDPAAGQLADVWAPTQRGRQLWLQATYRFH